MSLHFLCHRDQIPQLPDKKKQNKTNTNFKVSVIFSPKFHFCPEMQAMAKMAKMAKNRQTAGSLNWMPKFATLNRVPLPSQLNFCLQFGDFDD